MHVIWFSCYQRLVDQKYCNNVVSYKRLSTKMAVQHAIISPNRYTLKKISRPKKCWYLLNLFFKYIVLTYLNEQNCVISHKNLLHFRNLRFRWHVACHCFCNVCNSPNAWSARSHYLNQYWNIVNWTPKNKLMKFQSKCIHYLSSKSIWKCRLENGGHFVSYSVCVNISGDLCYAW